MKITIRIPKNTTSATMEVDGVKGPMCLKRTARIRQSMAAAEGSSLKRKPEFRDVVTCQSASR